MHINDSYILRYLLKYYSYDLFIKNIKNPLTGARYMLSTNLLIEYGSGET